VIGTPLVPKNYFSDNFETNEPNQWVNFGGGWQQKDGKYYSESYGIGGAKSVATTTNFTELSFDARITILTANTQGGLLFRVSDAATGVDAYKGYFACISTEGKLILGKASNSWQEIASVNKPFSIGQSYHVRVTAEGPVIKVFVDNMQTPLISATDSTFVSGSIGLRQYSSGVPDPEVIFETVSAISTVK
jgi:hypothetical protein